MAAINWRTINVDLLDPESPANFDVSSLLPSVPSASASEVQTLSSQIRQLLRGGDSEGALKGALENAPYGGDAQAKDVHLATIMETLQSIKQSDMSPMLSRIYGSEGGPETLDVLMKYLYKGMSHTSQSSSGRPSITPQATGGFSQIQSRGGGEGGGQAMSVLLSWHEKLVEIAGAGSIVRVMTDRRTV
ncbi:actin-related protein 2/3 complex subunit 5 [Usnea florida]